eukprot:TRINITY_DN15394_c0_g2_i8.p1 TRINITY_DN15394_c0_g2~~TRINITY_DN15394_c0_g2_i8.p1  ORF type:complete len:190 (+),score=0.65 TRINITY_DN15394_c0_g2_i8:670-1239(+)
MLKSSKKKPTLFLTRQYLPLGRSVRRSIKIKHTTVTQMYTPSKNIINLHLVKYNTKEKTRSLNDKNNNTLGAIYSRKKSYTISSPINPLVWNVNLQKQNSLQEAQIQTPSKNIIKLHLVKYNTKEKTHSLHDKNNNTLRTILLRKKILHHTIPHKSLGVTYIQKYTKYIQQIPQYKPRGLYRDFSWFFM